VDLQNPVSGVYFLHLPSSGRTLRVLVQ
jgi:hypothetical protein